MFKKFKSLFVIEEGAATEEGKQTSEVESGQKKETVSPTRPFEVPAGLAKDGKVQDKFLDVLFGALESNNQEGFDYMEFKDFLRSLANVPMDDSTRYKSAFATAQTMGATKEKILKSAQQYVSILANEQSKFQEALNGQKQRNLTGKQEEIRRLEENIKNKEAEIEKMKAEIQSHRTQIGTLEQEINGASEKLTQTANDFEATYQALLGQIQADVKNIESHL
jgi:vacuolar-type H+-ATPase subunit I/STV1